MGLPRRKRRAPSPVKPSSHVKRKQKSEENKLGIIAAMQDEGSSAKQAAKLFEIPPTMLKDRLFGLVVHGTKAWSCSLPVT